MKKFHFNLESLLTIRDWEEQEARQALAVANAHVQRIDNHLRDLSVMVEQAYESWGKKGNQSFSPTERMGLVAQVENTRREIAQVEQLKLKALEKRSQAMQAVIAASRKLKTVENLKDRRRQEYDAEVQRREAIEIEDIFNARRHNS